MRRKCFYAVTGDVGSEAIVPSSPVDSGRCATSTHGVRYVAICFFASQSLRSLPAFACCSGLSCCWSDACTSWASSLGPLQHHAACSAAGHVSRAVFSHSSVLLPWWHTGPSFRSSKSFSELPGRATFLTALVVTSWKPKSQFLRTGQLRFTDVPSAMFTAFRCFTDGCAAYDGTPLQEKLRKQKGPIFMLLA